MDCPWIKISPSVQKGIGIINNLDEMRFEQFLRRIISKLKQQTTEIFTEDESRKLENIFKINQENLLLSIKTIVYIFKRLLKFIFMPADLKNDLKCIGLSNDKTDLFVKVWSNGIHSTLNELGSNQIDISGDRLDFSWKLNAELSSVYHKKCKIPKAYLTLTGENDVTEIELAHSELYSVFLQFESIQNEIDNLFS